MRKRPKILQRLSEPSTYAGLAGLALALDQANVINEGQAVASVLGDVAANLVTGNHIGAILAGIFGAIAIFKADKKEEVN